MEGVLLELANDFYPHGLMSQATYRMITMRDADTLPPSITGADIRALRVKAHLSQAAFAR